MLRQPRRLFTYRLHTIRNYTSLFPSIAARLTISHLSTFPPVANAFPSFANNCNNDTRALLDHALLFSPRSERNPYDHREKVVEKIFLNTSRRFTVSPRSLLLSFEIENKKSNSIYRVRYDWPLNDRNSVARWISSLRNRNDSKYVWFVNYYLENCQLFVRFIPAVSINSYDFRKFDDREKYFDSIKFDESL